MGIVNADVANLVEIFKPHSPGKRVITLGRLAVNLHRQDVARLRRQFAGDPQAMAYFDGYRWGDYAEPLFREVFKCRLVDSLDYSAYEGATVVHDLQQPLPQHLVGQYDLVFDGGTLEHVFDIPTALRNFISLACVGGFVYANSPSNNLSGHGFYQFSPELMFRVLSEQNGLQIVLSRIGLAHYPSIEKSSGHRVYDVSDPDSIRSRVGLLGSEPAYLMVMARKTHAAQLFAQPVLQSDYNQLWSAAAPDPASRGLARRLLDRLPVTPRNWLLGLRERRVFSIKNPRFYRKI